MRNEQAVGELIGVDLADAKVRHGPNEPWQVPAESKFDYFRCGHCGNYHHVKPRQRPEDIGGFCRQCMRAICVTCCDTGRCEPLEKRLEMAEERQRTLREYGL